jgi:hypothetical protein
VGRASVAGVERTSKAGVRRYEGCRDTYKSVAPTRLMVISDGLIVEPPTVVILLALADAGRFEADFAEMLEI